MSQPRISQINFWEKHKSDIFLVIREALDILQRKPDLPILEAHSKKHNLNRELFWCFREATIKHKLPHHLPTPEGKNPPSDLDLDPNVRESKIPDFYWQVVDPVAGKERRFTLECKRLGSPSSANWNLNENYVQNGIRRFLSAPHEYGKDEDACGMIGYVQSMDLKEILDEINACFGLNFNNLSLLQPSKEGWQARKVSELAHDLERPYPVSPFRLYHFWVDIRNV